MVKNKTKEEYEDEFQKEYNFRYFLKALLEIEEKKVLLLEEKIEILNNRIIGLM